MLDRIKIIKDIKELRLHSDNVLFIIPESYSLEDSRICLGIIKKFNFKSISIEISHRKIFFLKHIKKINIANVFLSLNEDIVFQLRNKQFLKNFKIAKNLKLHLRIKSWQDLDILMNLEEICYKLDCKKVLIGIDEKKDIELPYVLNAIPIIYKQLNKKNLSITLKNINPFFFQTFIPLEINKLYIEPNNTCNLFCPFCQSGRRPKPRLDMDFNKFKGIIDQFPKIPEQIFLFGRGEPFLNKDVFKMIRHVKEMGCFCVTLSTNGHFLSKKNIANLFESRLDNLVIGLDSVRKETYKFLRAGGNFDLVLKNIKMLSQIKRKLFIKPEVYLQFIITRQNEEEISLMKKFTEMLGFRAAFKAVVSVNRKFIPLNHSFRRIKNKKILPSMIRNFCLAPWNSIYISCDGLTTLCCNLGFSRNIGNLNKDKLINIWNGSEYQNIRKQMLVDKHKIRFCTRTCPSDSSLTTQIIGTQPKNEYKLFYNFK